MKESFSFQALVLFIMIRSFSKPQRVHIFRKKNSTHLLTWINPTKPRHHSRDNFLMRYTVSTESGEQIHDKERQPANYKNAWIIPQPYHFHSIKQVDVEY